MKMMRINRIIRRKRRKQMLRNSLTMSEYIMLRIVILKYIISLHHIEMQCQQKSYLKKRQNIIKNLIECIKNQNRSGTK